MIFWDIFGLFWGFFVFFGFFWLFWIFWDFWLFFGFFGIFFKFPRLLLQFTEVTTDHQKFQNVGQNRHKSPPQELEEGPRSGPHLLVKTKVESNMLERCLKTWFHIIYQDKYLSFNNALQLSHMKSLKVRLLELITKFSKKVHSTLKVLQSINVVLRGIILSFLKSV